MTTPPRSEVQGPVVGRQAGRKAIAGIGAVPLISTLASALLLIWLPAAAQAHSDLASSDPVDGSSLASPPSKLVLTFSEGVAPRYTVVTLRVGAAEIATLKATATADRVTAVVPANVHGAGLWRVAYRVVSADGHSVAGQIAFRVNPTPAPSGVPTPTDEASPTQPSGTETAAVEDVLQETPRATNNRSGLHPGISVLIIALLVSAPVMVFVVVASRKRREDSRGPGR